MVADTISHSIEGSVMICACRAGSANEEWAYELFRSIQRIFRFLFIFYSVGIDYSFSVNLLWKDMRDVPLLV